MDINFFKPTGALKKKHLITLANYQENEIYEILCLARDLRTRLAAGEKLSFLKNKYVSLLTKRGFARSRIAFETAVTKLSGTPMVSTMHGHELENIINDKLTLKAVAGYGVNGIVVQTAESTDAEQLEKTVEVPIINANSKSGPCEVLSALMTIWKRKGKLTGLKVVAVGDPENYADSFLYGFVNCGMDVTVVCPEDNFPSEKIVNYCRQYSDFSVTDDLITGIKNADVVFVSDDDSGRDFLVDETALEKAKPDAIVLHTLPVEQPSNLDESVYDLPSFAVLEEANYLPDVEMAAITLLMGSGNL